MGMRTFLPVLVFAAIAGCGGTGGLTLEALPEQAGEWTRVEFETKQGAAGVESAPGMARELGARAWARARYTRGSAEVRVQAFLFPAEANAFEAQQKWERGAERTTFYRGARFAECASADLPTADLVRFATALEAAWLTPAQR